MFLLTSAWNPMANELGDWSARDLASFGSPRLFTTKEKALAFAQKLVDEQNDTNRKFGDFPEEEALRLVNEEDAECSVWVFGVEGSDPTDPETEQEEFVWFFCEPIAVDAE